MLNENLFKIYEQVFGHVCIIACCKSDERQHLKEDSILFTHVERDHKKPVYGLDFCADK